MADKKVLNLYEKLSLIQSEMKVPKGQFNSFGKYNYRSAEDILNAVKSYLTQYELVLTLNDQATIIGDWHYIQAVAMLINAADGERLDVSAYARESLTKKGMDDSQITGTASSYARKYALNGLFAIDDTKDADTDEFNKQSQQQPRQQQAPRQQAPKQQPTNHKERTPEQKYNDAINMAKGLGADEGQLKAWAVMPIDMAVRDLAAWITKKKEEQQND